MAGSMPGMGGEAESPGADVKSPFPAGDSLSAPLAGNAE
jgi:hypothetical protein